MVRGGSDEVQKRGRRRALPITDNVQLPSKGVGIQRVGVGEGVGMV